MTRDRGERESAERGDVEVAVLGRGAVTETLAVRRGDVELALKRLLPRGAESAEARESVAREARIVRRLDRDAKGATPALFARGEDARGPWLATVRVPLAPLSSIAPSLVRARFALLAREAFSVLARVHAASVVHGDLSGDNVLAKLDAPDAALCMLVDFGLARDLASGDGPPDDGAFRGTVTTVAPEVARGELPSLAADVFSMAATLVEAARGAPLRKAGVDLAVRLAEAASAPIADFAAAEIAAFAPAPIAHVLRACLADDPRSRPTSERALMLMTNTP